MNDIVYEEQKQLIKMWKDKYYEKKEEIERLNKKIEELYLDLQDTNSQLADYAKRFIKAIKYIEDMQKAPSYCDTWSTTAPHDIICILKGSDKE